MVTAELAACLPVLVLLIGVAVAVVDVVDTRVRALDAAREGARLAARGEPDRGVAVTHAIAPGAGVTVRTRAGLVTVTVVVRRSLPVPFLPRVAVTGSAVAAVEP